LASKNKLEQVKYEAEQRIAQATAEAEAIRIQAEALKSNPQFIALNWVAKWSGNLPNTLIIGNGEDTTLLLPLGNSNV
jgi:regulator of protease activity HflC (stomatin/prohibitin superfamily)